jgi:hypothetical protein
VVDRLAEWEVAGVGEIKSCLDIVGDTRID